MILALHILAVWCVFAWGMGVGSLVFDPYHGLTRLGFILVSLTAPIWVPILAAVNLWDWLT